MGNQAVEKARDHVRRKGHTLGHHEGSRPWSPFTVLCKNCGEKWGVLRSDAPNITALVAELNATERNLPTAWEILLDHLDDD